MNSLIVSDSVFCLLCRYNNELDAEHDRANPKINGVNSPSRQENRVKITSRLDGSVAHVFETAVSIYMGGINNRFHLGDPQHA